MRSPNRSGPFHPLPADSVPALFWRVLLRCGVLAGSACAVMLWGLRQPLIAIGTLVAVAVIVAVPTHGLAAAPWVGRAAGLAARGGVTIASAAAVVALAGTAGLVLVGLCLVLTPSVRAAVGAAWRWCVDLGDTVDAPVR